jgi:hypothetical protein
MQKMLYFLKKFGRLEILIDWPKTVDIISLLPGYLLALQSVIILKINISVV